VARHLIDLGHKKIAFFAGPMTSPTARERLNGYRRALREAGIESNDRLVYAAGSTIQEGQNAALQMLNEAADATAIQAANDLIAVGAAHVFQTHGLRIPADLSVAGYGNILLSEHCRVPLTTVSQPKMRLGISAIDLMQKLLRGEKTSTVRLPAEIIIRESTGPVKKR
jgi:DNA-binding LacI/PurR family transcriptional regulator